MLFVDVNAIECDVRLIGAPAVDKPGATNAWLKRQQADHVIRVQRQLDDAFSFKRISETCIARVDGCFCGGGYVNCFGNSTDFQLHVSDCWCVNQRDKTRGRGSLEAGRRHLEFVGAWRDRSEDVNSVFIG